MNMENAKNKLKFHGDMNQKNSFLYLVKEEGKCDEKLFTEIMDSIQVLSNQSIDIQQIQLIYPLIFWCRSWMNAGMLNKNVRKMQTNSNLEIYIAILEETLFYLLNGDSEEAFWAYNEFLDGRL